jgi:hypothetical protein
VPRAGRDQLTFEYLVGGRHRQIIVEAEFEIPYGNVALNRRPRPTLNLDTPADRLAALLDQAA